MKAKCATVKKDMQKGFSAIFLIFLIIIIIVTGSVVGEIFLYTKKTTQSANPEVTTANPSLLPTSSPQPIPSVSKNPDDRILLSTSEWTELLSKTEIRKDDIQENEGDIREKIKKCAEIIAPIVYAFPGYKYTEIKESLELPNTLSPGSHEYLLTIYGWFDPGLSPAENNISLTILKQASTSDYSLQEAQKRWDSYPLHLNIDNNSCTFAKDGDHVYHSAIPNAVNNQALTLAEKDSKVLEILKGKQYNATGSGLWADQDNIERSDIFDIWLKNVLPEIKKNPKFTLVILDFIHGSKSLDVTVDVKNQKVYPGDDENLLYIQ